MKACLLVGTKRGDEPDLLGRLEKMEGVQAAWATFGQADVVAMVAVDDLQGLDDLLDEVGRLPGVRTTETLPEMEVP